MHIVSGSNWNNFYLNREKDKGEKVPSVISVIRTSEFFNEFGYLETDELNSDLIFHRILDKLSAAGKFSEPVIFSLSKDEEEHVVLKNSLLMIEAMMHVHFISLKNCLIKIRFFCYHRHDHKKPQV